MKKILSLISLFFMNLSANSAKNIYNIDVVNKSSEEVYIKNIKIKKGKILQIANDREILRQIPNDDYTQMNYIPVEMKDTRRIYIQYENEAFLKYDRTLFNWRGGNCIILEDLNKEEFIIKWDCLTHPFNDKHRMYMSSPTFYQQIMCMDSTSGCPLQINEKRFVPTSTLTIIVKDK